MKKFISTILLSLAITATSSHGKEKIDPENWIRDMEEAYVRIDDYAAIFHKRERINGKLLEEEKIFLKFKKPFKVYMKWTNDPYKGREALYVEGWNRNRMMIYESRMMGGVTVSFNPKGYIAMKNSRHPITESGLGQLVKLIGENLVKGVKAGDLQFIQHDEETVYGCQTWKIELIFPKNKVRGYYCYRAILNIDVGKKLPLKVQIYDWDNILVEDYGYENLKLNVGLTDTDFYPKNPEYKF